MKKPTLIQKSRLSAFFALIALGFAFVAQANSTNNHTVVSEIGSQLNAVWQFSANLEREMLNHSQAENRIKADNKWAAWFRRETQRTDNMPVKSRNAEQNISLIHFGIENAVKKDTVIGAAVASSVGKTTFVDSSRGRQRMQAFALYAKKEWQHGIFGTLDLSYAKSRNRINNEVNFNRNITGIGLNVGQEIDILDSGMLMRPSIGVKHYNLSAANYKLDGLDVAVQKLNVISYRAGVSIAKPVKFGLFTLTPEMAANYVDSTHSTKFARVGDKQLEKQFGRHFKYEVGVNVKAGNWKVAVNGGLLNGSKISKQRFAGVKVSYHW